MIELNEYSYKELEANVDHTINRCHFIWESKILQEMEYANLELESNPHLIGYIFEGRLDDELKI